MKETPFVLVNNELSRCVDAFDRGLAYGDGLFETMRCINGDIPLLNAHIGRLEKGCNALKIALDIDVIFERIKKALSDLNNAQSHSTVVKLIVTRGVGGRGYRPAGCGPVTTIISTSALPSFPESYREEGISIKICEHHITRNKRLAGIKHLNKLDYVLAAEEWASAGYDEGLILDDIGNVIEATSRNVFAVKSGNLVTPKVDQCGVAGVMRNLLMSDVCDKLSLNASEIAMSIDDILASDEVFICNSVTGIWPVSHIGDVLLPKQKRVTKNIQHYLQAHYAY